MTSFVTCALNVQTFHAKFICNFPSILLYQTCYNAIHYCVQNSSSFSIAVPNFCCQCSTHVLRKGGIKISGNNNAIMLSLLSLFLASMQTKEFSY